MMPPPPPVEQWPWYQAEHIRRQTAALESIRGWLIGLVWIMAVCFGLITLAAVVG